MAQLRYERLPSLLAQAMEYYIERGIPPGGFLTAVLCNDLKDACARADDNNKRRLWDIVNWLYNEAPSPCWGHPDKVRTWIAARQSERAAAAS